eukprot:5468292-Prorocentrum_lima.AAC.1
MEFLKALEYHWKMSTPEQLGPHDQYAKLKYIGVMITMAKKSAQEFQDETYFAGQGAYTWE